MVKLVSTSALAKKRGLDVKSLVEKLKKQGVLETKDGNLALTQKGKQTGAEYKKHKTRGAYIVWPEDIELSATQTTKQREKKVSSADIGKHFDISANKINFILSELGLIEKNTKGWSVTPFGKTLKGVQNKNTKGVSYVVWSSDILQNKSLNHTVEGIIGTSEQSDFEAKYSCIDGHYVRSKAEMMIDNWLYMAQITHAYERKLPVEEDLYCDFYLPQQGVYIEYMGSTDEKDLEFKKMKQEIYKKYNFKLIELTDADIQNLDGTLSKKLLKFNRVLA